MRRSLVNMAVAAVLAWSMAAGAQMPRTGAGYSIRNDSNATIGCRVQHGTRSSTTETIVIPRGQAWTANADEGDRTIFCDPPAEPRHYRLQPGVRYHLVMGDHSVGAVLQQY